MNASESEKQTLEYQASLRFATAYSDRFETSVSFLRHNLPAKPDVSCEIDGRLQDLEIAHLYGSEAEAQIILGRELTPSTCAELQALQNTQNTHARLVTALNRILQSKADKHYDSANVWLVIQNAHPAWGEATIRANLEQVSVPENHPFRQIWLVSDLTSKPGLVLLYSVAKNELNPS